MLVSRRGVAFLKKLANSSKDLSARREDDGRVTPKDRYFAKLKSTKLLLPEGPWSEEPDYAEAVYYGYRAVFIRHSAFFSWQAYVAIPSDHFLNGITYDRPEIKAIEVHGGFVYSGNTYPLDDKMVTSAPSDIWWLCFDGGHYKDLLPIMLSEKNKGVFKDFLDERNSLSEWALGKHDLVYRNLNYMMAEMHGVCEYLNLKYGPGPHRTLQND